MQDEDGRAWTWLALGGAVSFDRHRRRIGKSWWPGETLTEADVASAVRGGVVDVVVNHDAPARVAVPNIDRKLGWSTDVTVDAESHRRLLLSACETLRPRQRWHGHYHCRYDEQLYLGPVDGRVDWDGVCHVHGLDCDDTAPDANLVLSAVNGTPLPTSRPSPTPRRETLTDSLATSSRKSRMSEARRGCPVGCCGPG